MLSSPQMQQYQRMGGYPNRDQWPGLGGPGDIATTPEFGREALSDTHPGLAAFITSNIIGPLAKMATLTAKPVAGKLIGRAADQANARGWANDQAKAVFGPNFGELDFGVLGGGTVPGTTPGSGIVGHDPSFGWGGGFTDADVNGFGTLPGVTGRSPSDFGPPDFGPAPDITVDIHGAGPRGGGDDGTDPGAPDPDAPDPDGIF
jgi:hypothetical protein